MSLQEIEVLRTRFLEQTPQARKIIAVLYDIADWATRDEIAVKITKNRLTPHDIALLDRLVVSGFIESKKRERSGRIGFEFIYRLKEEIHRGFNQAKQFRRQKS